MERSCRKCQATFVIHEDEQAFIQKMGFRYSSTTIQPPLPLLCPDCRCQARTAHRNERYLYKRRSACSGKDIVSLYNEAPLWGEPWIVYDQDEWRSDAWDPLSYGRAYDFNTPFFPQFAALQKSMPRMALISIGNENSGFSTGTGYCKNCYLINSSEYCEDCYYGKLLQSCSDSVDCSYLYNAELCYECLSCYECYHCQWLAFSQNCTDCLFSANLKSCSNCCLCTNLDHKEYHFLNEPLSKSDYENRLKAFQGHAERTQQTKAVWKQRMTQMIHKYAHIVNGENCTGDYIENSKNCRDCYDVNESEDCRYVHVGVHVKDNYDCSNMYLKPELCYETLGTIEVHTCAYCLFVFNSQRLLLCEYCFNCNDCFACSGLTRKKFCIFNKQYTQAEYEELVPRIIAHMRDSEEWGLFFPGQFAPFGYNESLAHEYFPLAKEQSRAKGFTWREKDPKEYRPASAQLPLTIGEATEALTQEIFACADCKKNYRIIPQELQFYRNQLLPLPRQCPDCRYDARLALRNPRKLWARKCGKCGKAVESTYAPDRPEIIFCEECYVKEAY